MPRVFQMCLLTAFCAPSVFGWGCEGHEVVALIARAHLTPAVSAAVDAILRNNPIDPALTRFCQDRPNDLMADAATWADDVKNQEKTGVWHYINIPRSVLAVADLNRWCPPIGPSVDGKNRPGCITNAIQYELGILRDKSRTPAERATALRYVIHFLGDIHQPLHNEDNNDQGGNCSAMQFFSEDRPANLHAIWDYKLIEHEFAKDKLTPATYAARLNAHYEGKYSALSGAKADDPEAWAWETHFIGNAHTYGDLDPGIPVATPDPQSVCAAQRDKIQALHIKIGDAYFQQELPMIEDRLATAGFRLALLLNDTLR